jgi:hypothetical protein
MQGKPVVVATACSIVASGAFQLTLALFPEKLRPYAWAVKWLWIVAAVFAVVWIYNKATEASSHKDDEAKPQAQFQEAASTFISTRALQFPRKSLSTGIRMVRVKM